MLNLHIKNVVGRSKLGLGLRLEAKQYVSMFQRR